MMKPKPGGHESDQRRAVCSLASFKAEGYYGGGCRTAVGRQKARKRACKAAKKVAQNAYKGKPLEWRKDLCRKKAGSTGKYSLIFVRGSGGKVEVIPHDEVKWIKFSRIKFRARAEDSGTTKSVKKRGEFTIKGDGNKFACKDGKPVLAGN